jgi:hypothetical protein
MSKVIARFSMSLDGFVADPAVVRLAPALWPEARVGSPIYPGGQVLLALFSARG